MQLLYPVGRYLGVREMMSEEDYRSSTMKCERIEEQLESITAIAITNNRQCMAIACKLLNDKSAYIFFFDMLQLHPLKKVGKTIHEGSPTDEEDKSFISINFSPEAKYLAALTNTKDGHARIYEWKKETRILSATSWGSELYKEKKGHSNADITKITMDPNNNEQICMSGKYHFRLWRNQGNILRPMPQFAGVDQAKVYTDHCWMDGGWLVAGTDKGELYFVYDSKQFAFLISAFGSTIDEVSCLCPYNNVLLVGGCTGVLSVWDRKDALGTDFDVEKLKDEIKYRKNVSKHN